MNAEQSLVKMQGICKHFGGVIALDSMQFELRAGEVHALLGENGAGKSTLIKIISGVYTPDSGEIQIGNCQVDTLTPAKARALGVATVFQELSLVNELTVAENIFLGHVPCSAVGHVQKGLMEQRTKELLEFVGVSCQPGTKVGNLGVAQQQLIEIAKALSTDPSIIIMDEPTDKLYGDEQEHLYTIIEKLKAEGKGIIYISHKLEELFIVSDRITVLRDGRYVKTLKTVDTDNDELIRLMVGRDIDDLFPKETAQVGAEALRVEELSYGNFLDHVSFSAYKGEILGVGGLVGAGRSLVAKCIAGIICPDQGRFFIDNKEYKPTSPKEAIRNRVVYLPEDRKHFGVVMGMSCLHNIMLPSLKKSVVHKDKMLESCKSLVERLSIKAPSLDTKVQDLSGGNQQKVVIAKWLYTKASVFIFDEPTQGIDVGTKAEIYKLMNALVQEGACIIMISSDMRELIAMSDRVMVMNKGRVSGILERKDATQENILGHAIVK